MADTLQILYTHGGTVYAKTRSLLPHDGPVLDYVALLMMKELLDDVRIGEEESTRPMCRCGKNPEVESHSCPFASEIGGDKSDDYCNCCDECRIKCSMDV